MKKTIRFTKHARERLRERLPVEIKKVVKLFQGSIFTGTKDGAELHENEGIVFVVRQWVGYKYHLITVYKKSEVDALPKATSVSEEKV